jgi:hypothetical protein
MTVAPASRGADRPFSRGVIAVVALVTAWALAPIVYLLIEVLRHGGVLSGAGSATAGADQFQYLSWIRESGLHGLISDQFELAPNAAAFLHPMFLLSGLAWRLGLPLQLALLLWEPIAIAVMVGGFAAYIARSEQARVRVAVLLLAIFYLTPILAVLDWTHQLSFGHVFDLQLGLEEVSPAWQLWGYLPTAISLGLMPLALLAGERALSGRTEAHRRYMVAAAAASLAVAWLHPWQGATLVLVWIGIVCWGRDLRSRLPLLAPALAALAPLVYYQLLARYDHAWQIAQAQNRQPHFPLWVLAAALGPLAVPAAVGLLNRPRGVHDRTTRLWVACGLLVYFAEHTFELHALQGLSLPLAVLAAAGWRRLFTSTRVRTVAATVAIALVTIPGVIWSASWYRTSIRGHYEPYVFTASEHAALTFLERAPARGGVLASRYLGMAVPAFTGRATWVGHKVWTPGYAQRLRQANALLSGRLGPAEARALVRSSGAAFVLADCSERADIGPLLGSLVTAVHSFGCVTVYSIGPYAVRSVP